MAADEKDSCKEKAGLDFLLDYSKGTVWWVGEPGSAVPAVSLLSCRFPGESRVVPMLIGEIGNERLGLKISDIDGHGGVAHLGAIRPVALKFDGRGRAQGIWGNADKPRLSASEMAALDSLLKSEGR